MIPWNSSIRVRQYSTPNWLLANGYHSMLDIGVRNQPDLATIVLKICSLEKFVHDVSGIKF
jgi:hypothetical protein